MSPEAKPRQNRGKKRVLAHLFLSRCFQIASYRDSRLERPDRIAMKPRSSDFVQCSLVHSFLEGKLLKSIVTSHDPLVTSQAFAIVQSEILHHLGSTPGEKVHAFSDDAGLILNPVLARQVAMRHTHLLSVEVLDAFFGIKSFESFFQVLTEGIRQFAKFDRAHLIEFCRFIFEFVPGHAIITPEQARAR
jgi:hypothetical protein